MSRFTDSIPEPVFERFQGRRWYRHGIYRNNILFTSAYMKNLGAEHFAEEGVALDIPNLVSLGPAAFLDEDEFKNNVDTFVQKIEEEGLPYLAGYVMAHTKSSEGLLAVSAEISSAEYGSDTNEQLAEKFGKFADAINDTAHWLWSMEFLNPAVDAYIESRIRETGRDPEPLLERISYPTKPFSFQEEKAAIAALPSLDAESVDALWREFQWLSMNAWDGMPFEYEAYQARVRDMKESDTLTDDVVSFTHHLQDAAKAIDELPEPELRETLRLARDLIYLKTWRIDAYTRSFFAVLGLFKEIAIRLNIPYEHLFELSTDEIRDALLAQGTEVPRDFKLRKRFVIARLDGDMYCLYGDVVSRMEAVLYKEDFSSISELKGKSAFPGIVRGTAKILMTDKDLYKLEKGDILVANLTNPNYDPAFGTVAGVVTDEGGLLCHSAIMAREFRIPCVVGTKIATRAFKDGDRLEVNAHTGIVRKIESL